jgi:hypothetical protein
MKRWFPILFLGLSLLANIVVHIRYTGFLETWTPVSDYSSPQPLGLFALFSVPFGLAYLWRIWGPDKERHAALGRARRHCGNALLIASSILWLYYRIDSIVCAWIAATPTPDPLNWLRISFNKSNISTLSLVIGGLLALWLKGIRIPPHKGGEVK